CGYACARGSFSDALPALDAEVLDVDVEVVIDADADDAARAGVPAARIDGRPVDVPHLRAVDLEAQLVGSDDDGEGVGGAAACVHRLHRVVLRPLHDPVDLGVARAVVDQVLAVLANEEIQVALICALQVLSTEEDSVRL